MRMTNLLNKTQRLMNSVDVYWFAAGLNFLLWTSLWIILNNRIVWDY